MTPSRHPFSRSRPAASPYKTSAWPLPRHAHGPVEEVVDGPRRRIARQVALLQNELPGFRQALQAMGYEKVLLVAKPVKLLSPENDKRFAALARGVPERVSLLDVKA